MSKFVDTWYNLPSLVNDPKIYKITVRREIYSTAEGYDLLTFLYFENGNNVFFNHDENWKIRRTIKNHKTMQRIYNNPDFAYFDKFVSFPVFIRILENLENQSINQDF